MTTYRNVLDDREAAIRSALDALVSAILAATEPTPSPDAPDRLYSVPEAAKLLGIGRSRLYVEIGAGRVRSVKVGSRRLIPASAIRDFAVAGS